MEPKLQKSLVSADDFTEFIQKEIHWNIQLWELRKKPRLILKEVRQEFSQEIRNMMYVFGDVKTPLLKSVKVVEKVLREQMNLLLMKATRVRSLQGGEELTHKHLLYLLQRNKVKLRRLLVYLNVKDTKDAISRRSGPFGELCSGPTCGKRITDCFNFLSTIGNEKEFRQLLDTSIDDPITVRRAEMRYLRTLNMNDEEYCEFSKIQQASFLPKGGETQFKEWLLKDSATHLTPTHLALEIINYLARDTVCEIVELSLLVKKHGFLSHSSYLSLSSSYNIITRHENDGVQTLQVDTKSCIITSIPDGCVLEEDPAMNESTQSIPELENTCSYDMRDTGMNENRANHLIQGGLSERSDVLEFPDEQSSRIQIPYPSCVEFLENEPISPENIKEALYQISMTCKSKPFRRKMKPQLLCI